MDYQRPKGTADILPGESEKWQYVEESARAIFKDYDYHEVRTPIFEHFELVARGVGDTTDIVSKEMYDFHDKGNRHVTLRPEGTAPVVRAFVENKLYGPEHPNPCKLYYMGPMFRYERPQAGRLRQFHQIGAEVLGEANPAIDVENMMLAMDFYKRLGVKHTRLIVNSIGDRESRAVYRQALIDYLEPHFEELSEDSKRRLHTNPLRVLDSKDDKDKKIVAEAPSILDYLNEYSASYFEQVKEMLEALNVSYEIDYRMVRGLDYYNHTVFEIMSEAPGFGGAITTICAGGRYDGLVAELGGPEIAGVGFALGIERALITIAAENVEVPLDNGVDVYVVGLGEETNTTSLRLVQAVRGAGFSADRDFTNRKAKAQFKTADKLKAEIVLVIGENELRDNTVNVKNMSNGKEQLFNLTEVYENFKKVYDTVTKEN